MKAEGASGGQETKGLRDEETKRRKDEAKKGGDLKPEGVEEGKKAVVGSGQFSVVRETERRGDQE